MALTYTNFSSFDEVVTHYNNITPLRGAQNKGKDIRPIGDRARNWERIVKVSPNCYALSDGFHFGDEDFGGWYYGANKFKPTLKHMEQYAPIVWRKKRDGTEEVTLRNGYGQGNHNGRYAFLYRHTPKGMWFRNRGNGKHYIQNGPTEHYLAKVRTAPAPVYRAIMNNAANTYWAKRLKSWVMLHNDNSAVVFRKNEHGGWEHVEGTGADIPQAPRVNKEAKAKYKDAIKSFFEWGMAMSPLLPLEDMEYRQERQQEMRQYFEPDYKGWAPRLIKTGDARAIVQDEEHPMRLALWVGFAAECTDDNWGFKQEYYTKTVETKEDLARVRSRYNRFINITLGFMTK